MENNTIAGPLAGAGPDHCKAQKKNKKQKTSPTINVGPQLCKAKVNKIKKKAPNQ
jgi:hypothetical protein